MPHRRAIFVELHIRAFDELLGVLQPNARQVLGKGGVQMLFKKRADVCLSEARCLRYVLEQEPLGGMKALCT